MTHYRRCLESTIYRLSGFDSLRQALDFCGEARSYLAITAKDLAPAMRDARGKLDIVAIDPIHFSGEADYLVRPNP